jgi:LysM repeat protein
MTAVTSLAPTSTPQATRPTATEAVATLPVESVQPSAPPTAPPSATPSSVPTPTPAPTYRTYRIQSGDTLATIAQRFHTTVSALSALNHITDPRRLHIGQVLLIP